MPPSNFKSNQMLVNFHHQKIHGQIRNSVGHQECSDQELRKECSIKNLGDKPGRKGCEDLGPSERQGLHLHRKHHRAQRLGGLSRVRLDADDLRTTQDASPLHTNHGTFAQVQFFCSRSHLSLQLMSLSLLLLLVSFIHFLVLALSL